MSDEVFRQLLHQQADASDVFLNDTVAAKLTSYFHLLAHWNTRINLTSLPLDPPTAQAVDRLFIEPLVSATLPFEYTMLPKPASVATSKV